VFERFTPEARRIVTGGVDVARQLRHDWIGPEHLLIAVAATGPNVAAGALRSCRFDPGRAREDLERSTAHRSDDLTEADVAALRTIGVDLDEVRRSVENSFGPGALQRRRRWSGRTRTRVCGLPFMPSAKQAIELALRETIRLGDRSIGPEHVLLALLRSDGPQSQLLRAQAIDPADVRDEVVRSLGEARRRGA
jgi:ATP-dependent Clp protease ATP-binding subunit ClpA